jgi:hypothetical protein
MHPQQEFRIERRVPRAVALSVDGVVDLVYTFDRGLHCDESPKFTVSAVSTVATAAQRVPP